jgi:hypothetical protein
MIRHLPNPKLLCGDFTVGLILCIVSTYGLTEAANRPQVHPLTPADSAFMQRAVDNHDCPCGCGNQLPGSTGGRACFGCSVGKAEVSRLQEGLARGDSRTALLLAMESDVLVDVFADYSDRNLPRVWAMVRKAAEAAQIGRVVLRTPGRTRGDRRAVALVECARDQGMFSRMQERFVKHTGPWDDISLLRIAADEGLDTTLAFDCLQLKDVQQQVAKDRQHATQRNLHRFPAVSVDRTSVRASEAALREALREAVARRSY